MLQLEGSDYTPSGTNYGNKIFTISSLSTYNAQPIGSVYNGYTVVGRSWNNKANSGSITVANYPSTTSESIGTGGTCYTGIYKMQIPSTRPTKLTIFIDSSPTIEFSDTLLSVVPTTVTANFTMTTTLGNKPTSGFWNSSSNISNFVPNIDPYYGAGGNSNAPNGGPPIVRIWFMTTTTP